ncbi:hypothetical protein CMI48_00910 [Candidatus Pacearchaeota archaeon]|jgi:hypothetical protein|nr:hypothetical protein [Candidatus Pacearchaeota archaeon]|tara:strand:+ start:1046 stop:1369 length:324 start_codon:yes stop_codon:yes gene_type:complete
MNPTRPGTYQKALADQLITEFGGKIEDSGGIGSDAATYKIRGTNSEPGPARAREIVSRFYAEQIPPMNDLRGDGTLFESEDEERMDAVNLTCFEGHNEVLLTVAKLR